MKRRFSLDDTRYVADLLERLDKPEEAKLVIEASKRAERKIEVFYKRYVHKRWALEAEFKAEIETILGWHL